jgi:glycosyltransferase involved in cell wall biosynthesis
MELKPLRILRLVERYDRDAAGGHMSYVAVAGQALAERGHDVHVLACMQGGPAEDFCDGGVQVHRRNGPQIGLGNASLSKAGNRLYQIVAHLLEHELLGGGFDIIESPEFRACGLLLAFTGTCPVVVRLHTPLVVEADSDPGLDPVDVRLSDMLEQALVRQATMLTAATHWLPQQLRERGWLDNVPVQIIRNPVELDRWVRATPVEATEPIVVGVGRLEPRKAPETLVRALALLKPRVPQARLVLLGRSNGSREGKPYGDWVRSVAEQLQVPCQFVDDVPATELPGIYERARVVAIPSAQEGFSNVAVEAMAAGRAVVCTSSTGVAEMIRGSAAGAVVPPGDPAALADALEPYLLSTERAAHSGHAARALVQAECDPKVVGRQLESCYREAISRWPDAS